MKCIIVLVAVFVITLGGVIGAEDPTEALEGVQDLTPDTFDLVVNGAKHALVEFYAPWCGHCKHLTPEYKKVGAAVLKDGKMSSRVVVAKVNADEHRSLGERFGVQGFPTIKYFARGAPVDEPEDYQGPRKADDFLAFLTTKMEEDKGFARLPDLDDLARLFQDAPDLPSAFEKLSKKAGEVTEEAQKLSSDLYVKYGQKSVEKGVGYFQSEYDRLERMLGSGKVGSSKLGEISRKLSVLGAFLEGRDAAES